MQFAFPVETGIQKPARVMVQKPVSVALQRNSALAPIDHPPKFDIAL